jgi:hypothetical protein
MLPAELIDWPFLMGHERLAGTLVEQLPMAPPPSRPDGVLQHPPETFDGIAGGPAMGR